MHNIQLFKRKECVIRTRRFGGYFKSLLNGGDGAVEVGVTGREYAAEDTVEKDVRFLVGELLQDPASETPNAARGVVGDRQIPEDVLEALGRRGRRRSRGRRCRYP